MLAELLAKAAEANPLRRIRARGSFPIDALSAAQTAPRGRRPAVGLDMTELSDTAWISLAVIVCAVAILLVVVLLRKQDAVLSLETKWGKFNFSAKDAGSMLLALYESLPKSMIDDLAKFETGQPPRNELASIDKKTLDALVRLKLIQDPSGNEEAYDTSRLRLAYVGWQILESYIRRRPTSDPLHWPDKNRVKVTLIRRPWFGRPS